MSSALKHFTTSSIMETSPPSAEVLWSALADNFVYYLNKLEQIPGGPILLRYIKSSYQDDPVRSLFEYCLVLVAIKYFLSSKKRGNKSEMVLFSEKEIDELCMEWEPAPLVSEVTAEDTWELKCVPEIIGPNGPKVNLEQGEVINLTSYDFLDRSTIQKVKDVAKNTISNVGVGACGPPNFYGTQDIHVRFEEDIARYLDAESAIIYGQDFPTAGSVLPSYLKRGDLCVVDRNVNLAIQKALIVGRCDIEWYDDIDHLQTILAELEPELTKIKPLTRRFIVTEGLFAKTGTLADLPSLVELKNKYKYRLVLDETLSLGTVGKSGRGVAEYYGVPRSEICITIGSMALSLASSGGFCVGEADMIYHQRLQSLAFVFSAALPPYCASAASEILRELTEETSSNGASILVNSLQHNIAITNKLLAKTIPKKYAFIVSNENSPIIHIQLSEQYRERLDFPLFYGNTKFLDTGKPSKKQNDADRNYRLESFLLQKIIDQVLKHNILITRTKLMITQEHLPLPPPHLLLMLNSSISEADLKKTTDALKAAIIDNCSQFKDASSLDQLELQLLVY